jgi:Raf kinase inhibitor-like YbhB/YbcL family protein
MKTALIALAALVLASPLRAADFSLTSTDMTAGQALKPAQVLNGFGCSGGNVSPQLSWSHAPAGARSFVVTAYDPDAPTGSGWWHWVVFNIPADTTSLATGASSDAARMPAGAVQSRTDFGAPGFGGACPPPGRPAHRYIFRVTALKVDRLDLPEDASAALVGFMTHLHSLGSAELVALYGR